jgi:ribosomal protein S27E
MPFYLTFFKDFKVLRRQSGLGGFYMMTRCSDCKQKIRNWSSSAQDMAC